LAAGAVADLYTVPQELHHFTSLQSAEAVLADGKLEARPGSHGNGVYATRFGSPEIAAFQRAASTEASFTLPTQGLQVKPTPIPGTFRIVGDVSVRGMVPQKHDTSAVLKVLQAIDWRDKVSFTKITGKESPKAYTRG
jgi:hypothetical protein